MGVLVHHPGGTSTPRHVLTRDLSAGGLSFLHNGYMHTGTRVDMNLQRFVGGEDTVSGRVIHCAHIAGTWHTVGVKFNAKVFPKLYLDPDQAGASTVDATQPQAIQGRVLLLEDAELDRRLFAHHLRKTRVELTLCETLDDAEAQIKRRAGGPEAFELAVVEVRLSNVTPAVEPAAVVTRLVATGVRVAACSAETDPKVLQAVKEAGTIGVLRKPYDPDRLLGNIVDWLGLDTGGDRILSSLADQPDMRPLLTEFVGKAKLLGQALAEAVRNDDFDRARNICITLRGSGAGYGFHAVTEAAGEVLQLLETSKSLANAGGIVDRLRAVCARVTDAGPAEDDALAA